MLLSSLIHTIVENCVVGVGALTHGKFSKLTCVLGPDLVVERTLDPDITECHHRVEGLLVGLAELWYVLIRELGHMLLHEFSL